MPPRLSSFAAVASKAGPLFCCRKLPCFPGINADADHIKLPAGIPFQVLQTLDQAIENHRAEHRTLVIAKHQDDRFMAKVATKLDRAAVLILKLQSERNLDREFL